MEFDTDIFDTGDVDKFIPDTYMDINRLVYDHLNENHAYNAISDGRNQVQHWLSMPSHRSSQQNHDIFDSNPRHNFGTVDSNPHQLSQHDHNTNVHQLSQHDDDTNVHQLSQHDDNTNVHQLSQHDDNTNVQQLSQHDHNTNVQQLSQHDDDDDNTDVQHLPQHDDDDNDTNVHQQPSQHDDDNDTNVHQQLSQHDDDTNVHQQLSQHDDDDTNVHQQLSQHDDDNDTNVHQQPSQHDDNNTNNGRRKSTRNKILLYKNFTMIYDYENEIPHESEDLSSEDSEDESSDNIPNIKLVRSDAGWHVRQSQDLSNTSSNTSTSSIMSKHHGKVKRKPYTCHSKQFQMSPTINMYVERLTSNLDNKVRLIKISGSHHESFCSASDLLSPLLFNNKCNTGRELLDYHSPSEKILMAIPTLRGNNKGQAGNVLTLKGVRKVLTSPKLNRYSLAGYKQWITDNIVMSMEIYNNSCTEEDAMTPRDETEANVTDSLSN
jgi:hypothetical protein